MRPKDMKARLVYFFVVVTIAKSKDLEPEELIAQFKGKSKRWLPDIGEASPAEDLFIPCPGHPTGEAGETFMELVNTLIVSECILAAPCTYPADMGGYCSTSKMTFDFIVIGAGSTGSVVASRLSEVPEWNVLLLEAGGDPPITSDVPTYYQTLQRSGIDWEYTTEREEGMYSGLWGRVNRWPRGKVLGGTSTMNAMLYMRGSRRDYDNWAAEGNTGWNYEDVLIYFKRSEDMRDPAVIKSDSSSKLHGRKGPMSVSRFGSDEKIIKVIQDAALELGYAPNSDLNGVTQTGFTSPNQGTIRGGERLNTAKAYLNPIKKRKNLFVIHHALVTKIHICPSTKKVDSVSYLWKKEKVERTLKATKEVIICAGAVGSPKLLMLSGIGPKSHLRDVGVCPIEDLPVGKGLTDQVMFVGAPIVMDPVSRPLTKIDIMDAAYEYLTRRTGPLADIGVSELVGLISTDEDDRADVQLFFVYGRQNDSAIPNFLKYVGVNQDLIDGLIEVNQDHDILLPIPVLLRPLSRGRIRLKSNNALEEPIITAGYLTAKEDLDTMLRGIRWVEKLATTESLKRYRARVHRLNYPGCCHLDFGTDAFWACALSHVAGTFYNPAGTCRMGSACDPKSVVDPQLKVHRIKNLRVADASIMPHLITGSTNAACIMIGEKLSDMIKCQWLNLPCTKSVALSPKNRFMAIINDI